MAGAVSQSRVGCRLGAFACLPHAGVPLFFYALSFIYVAVITPRGIIDFDRVSKHSKHISPVEKTRISFARTSLQILEGVFHAASMALRSGFPSPEGRG